MEDEEGYMVLDRRGKRGPAGSTPALQGAVLHLQAGSPGSCRTGNGNIGGINKTLENFVLELREVLCPSQPPGAEGCRICPQGWTMNGDRCYWVSDANNPWSKSREDCGDRGATLLLLLRDRDELDLLNETLQKPGRHFWIGLWVPVPGAGWTWVNGSRLHRDRFQVDHTDKPGDCGMLRSSRIISQECSLESQWICQREVTKL